MNQLFLSSLKRFLKETLLIGLVISLPVYAWVRLIFFEVPFSLTEDTVTLFKVVMTGWVLMIGIKGFYYTILALAAGISRSSIKPAIRPRWSITAIIVVALCSMLYACNGQTLVGVKKDFDTGMVANYNGIEPGKVLLVMNDEELNHTDIPIGESFYLINQNVKGLKVKDGKVSVGCSLSITDKNGKKLLEEADLFKGKDVFAKEDAETLRCTVNTGNPMEWEEKYEVEATFWDKYGKGKISNKVTIRMIDIPKKKFDLDG